MIKRILLSNYLLYSCATWLYFLKASFIYEVKAAKIKTNSFLSQSELVDIVRKFRFIGSGVCHVIGSGWSLNKSLHKISTDDFVIGFNYSGLSDLRFDVYIAEFGGYSVSNASFDHYKIATELLKREKPPLILFKNVWEWKNDINFLNAYWVNVAWFVRDRIYPLPSKKNLFKVLDLMMKDSSIYFPQCVSTVIFSILLAYKAGFSSIVVHGVDFGGRYFYECDGFVPAIPVFPNAAPQSGFYGSRSDFSSHPTSTGRVKLQDLLLSLNSLFLAQERGLYCGTSLSPSSQFLPVYKSNSV